MSGPYPGGVSPPPTNKFIFVPKIHKGGKKVHILSEIRPYPIVGYFCVEKERMYFLFLGWQFFSVVPLVPQHS